MDFKYSKRGYDLLKLSEGKFLGSFVKPEDMPGELREVCFIGRSNSGKSTLLSSLFQNPSIVKTSGRPGSTRTVNFYQLNQLYLVDLPGYGYAKTSHSGRDELSNIIGKYISHRTGILCSFLLIDCLRDPGEEERYIIDLMKERRIPLVLILTKTDRLNQKEMAQLGKKITGGLDQDFFQVFAVSGKKRENLNALYQFILSLGAGTSA